jgi:flavin reductase (DIM6/NTAB) family NADH-FMN oxidoreductase RutF
MFYRPGVDAHGFEHNPFKALVVPRPIAWISTIDPEGHVNLAPFSYFNAIATDPPMVMFSAGGESRLKDTPRNIIKTKEFVVNIVPEHLFAEMTETAQAMDATVDETERVGVATRPSRLVAPPCVADSPVNLECRLFRNVELPWSSDGHSNTAVIGEVIGIHIGDHICRRGRLHIDEMKPIARLGYDEYAIVNNAITLSNWLSGGSRS